MLIYQIPIISVLLFISLFSASQELLGVTGRHLKVSFMIVSCGILYFSLNHNLLCSDYDSYSIIYDNVYTSTPIEEMIGIDKAFIALSATWKLLFNVLDFSLFMRVYQTIGLGLIIFSISRLSWSNTVMFLIIFGSLQFYHLSLCASRQGFSSGFVAIIFSLAIESLNSKINFVKSFKFMFMFGGLFLLSIYTHWTGLLMGIIFYISFVFSRNILSFKPQKKNIFTKSFKWGFQIPVLIATVSTIFYFSRSLAAFERLNIYLSQTGEEYGNKIAYTFFADIIFLLMSIYEIKAISKKLDNKNKATDFPGYSGNFHIAVALALISLLSLFFKLIAFLGYGTTIRIVIELTMLQYLFLPTFLERIKKPVRFLIVLLLSVPYLYFIFFVSQQEFQ
jgi:hypothetical protein